MPLSTGLIALCLMSSPAWANDMECADEAGFGGFEVDILARLWGVDMSEAKARVCSGARSGETAAMMALVDGYVSTSARYAYAEDATPAEPDQVAYEHSAYTSCDAAMLAMAWGVEPAQAQGRLGIHIRTHDTAGVEQTLERVRREQPASCGFHQSEFSYQDAVTLGALWGHDDVNEAKAQVERALEKGQAAKLRVLLGGPPDVRRDRWMALNGPFAARFPACEAQALSRFWGLSETEARLRAGTLLDNGRGDLLEEALVQARGPSPCVP